MRIRAELRFKNEELISRRLQAGYKTQAEFAKAIGVCAATVSHYECLRMTPRSPVTKEALEVALGCKISVIFPACLKEISKKLTMPRSQVIQLKQLEPYMIGGLLPKGPEERYESREFKEFIEESLELLTEQERKVLIYSFGLKGEQEISYVCIGKMFKVGPERIRQIRATALKKLSEKRYGLKDKMGAAVVECFEKRQWSKAMAWLKKANEKRELKTKEWLDDYYDIEEIEGTYTFKYKPRCRPDCKICGGVEFKNGGQSDTI